MRGIHNRVSYPQAHHKCSLQVLRQHLAEPPSGPVEGNFWPEIVYDYSATYSPNPDNPPFYVDLPVAYPSGELIQEVWDRWLGFDPVVNVHDRLDNLRKLSGILLDGAGRGEPPAAGSRRVLLSSGDRYERWVRRHPTDRRGPGRDRLLVFRLGGGSADPLRLRQLANAARFEEREARRYQARTSLARS
jgi:hypothetical protein